MKKLLLLLIIMLVFLVGCTKPVQPEELKYDDTSVIEAEVVTIGVVRVTSIGLKWRELLEVDTLHHPVDTSVYIKLYTFNRKVVKAEVIGIAEEVPVDGSRS